MTDRASSTLCLVRQRDSWSLIPSFAQRRMAAGLPISLLRIPEDAARSEAVADSPGF